MVTTGTIHPHPDPHPLCLIICWSETMFVLRILFIKAQDFSSQSDWYVHVAEELSYLLTILSKFAWIQEFAHAFTSLLTFISRSISTDGKWRMPWVKKCKVHRQLFQHLYWSFFVLTSSKHIPLHALSCHLNHTYLYTGQVSGAGWFQIFGAQLLVWTEWTSWVCGGRRLGSSECGRAFHGQCDWMGSYRQIHCYSCCEWGNGKWNHFLAVQWPRNVQASFFWNLSFIIYMALSNMVWSWLFQWGFHQISVSAVCVRVRLDCPRNGVDAAFTQISGMLDFIFCKMTGSADSAKRCTE